MKDIRFIRGLAALVLLSTPVHAEDLLDAYRAAQQNDPTYQAAKYALDSVRQRVPQAFSALLPAMGVTANAGRTLADTEYTGTPTLERDYKSHAWTLQLSQPLLRLSSKSAYDESKAIAEQAEAEFDEAEQDLILRVVQAYFDVLIAEEGVAASNAQVTAMQEQLALAQHSFSRGTASITDADEAKAHADLAYAQRISALNELEVRKAEFESIVGRAPDTLSALKTEASVPGPEPDQLQPWVERAQSVSPAARARVAALEAAQAEVRRNRYQRLPTVDLVASYGQNYSSGNVTNPSDYSTQSDVRQVGIQLSMPIVDGGGLSASVREARAKARKAEFDLEAARRKSATEAKEAFSGIVSGLVQIGALESAVAAGDRSVKGNQAGYRLGIRINSDVLNAEQQLHW